MGLHGAACKRMQDCWMAPHPLPPTTKASLYILCFPFPGINLTKKELLELIANSDRDGTGDIGYDEFLEVMTETLQAFREQKTEDEEEQPPQVRPNLSLSSYALKPVQLGA